MGKMKENPRYVIASFRVSDDEFIELQNMKAQGETWNDLLYRKVFEREKNAKI